MRRKSGKRPFALEDLARGSTLHEPPRAVVLRAVALGSSLAPGRPGPLTRLARCIFDSGAAPALAGVRSAASRERRMLFRIGDGPEATEIDLLVRRERHGTIELTGQVLPPIPGTIRVTAGGARARSARIASGGEFRMRGVGTREPVALEIRSTSETTGRIDSLPLPDVGTLADPD